MAPAALVAQAGRDAVAEGSVRVVSTFRRGTLSRTVREDVALDLGRQLIHFGSIRAEVVRIGDRAYITGNAAAMVKYFGLPSRDRSQLANHWVALTPADSGFHTVVADVTIRSDIASLLPSGSLTRTESTLGGKPVVVITGSPPASEHAPAGASVALYVSEGANPLPIREAVFGPDGTTGTETLSRWGESVAVSAPRQSTLVSSLVPGG